MHRVHSNPLARRLLTIALIELLCSANYARSEQWPHFRGPTGQGHSQAKHLPIEWGGPDEKNILWKMPLTGEGHASPIVWDDRIFVCTAHWPDAVASQDQRKQQIPEHHVLCFRLADGKQLWDTQVEPGSWLRDDFRSGPGGGYAAPTPVTDGKQVYVVFGSSVIAALDFDGRVVWRQAIEPHNFDVTIGTSPLLFGDTVLMLCAMRNQRDSSLIAYNRQDGSVSWQKPLPETGFAHSTPLLIEAAGKPQLIFAASGIRETNSGVQSLDPRTGDVIWTCRGGGDASSPAYGAGIVYCDNGRGGPGVAIEPTGTGDVTNSHVKWRIDLVPEGIGSPVIADGLVYRLHRPNVLKCWQASDGKEVYAQRLDGLSTTWASPIVDAAGRLYVANAGLSYVIQTGREYQLLATNDLGDPNHASPAVAGDKLILVGAKSVYCIGAR